jgi:hypothetical protein
MQALTPQQIDVLAQDIAVVRQAIQKNAAVIRQIDIEGSVRVVSLVGSIAAIAFCLTLYGFAQTFGGSAAVVAHTVSPLLSIPATAGIGFLIMGFPARPRTSTADKE